MFFAQSVFQRIFGMGNLIVESAGEQGRQEFSTLSRPQRVQAEIYRQKEADEARSQGVDTVGTGAVGIPAQIEQLDDLRVRGLLTDAEFQAKKSELLDRL